MRPATLLLVHALLTAAALEARDPNEPRERPAACEIVEIRSDHGAGSGSRFSATKIVELRFETALEGRPRPERRLRLRLTTPGGFLYQVLSVPVDPNPTKRRLVARLPVAGTSIMASGLYGRWTVTPVLGDGSEACGASRRFVINP